MATTIRCGVRNPSRGKRWVIDWVGDISNNREVFGIATQKYLVRTNREPQYERAPRRKYQIMILYEQSYGLKINI